jgi:hypothetical protein
MSRIFVDYPMQSKLWVIKGSTLSNFSSIRYEFVKNYVIGFLYSE